MGGVGGWGGVVSNCWVSGEGVGVLTNRVRPRGCIAEVEQFEEGGRIKTWGQWLDWVKMGFYRGEGISRSPPPPPPSYEFPKEEE